jgi:hypothetical protein
MAVCGDRIWNNSVNVNFPSCLNEAHTGATVAGFVLIGISVIEAPPGASVGKSGVTVYGGGARRILHPFVPRCATADLPLAKICKRSAEGAD